MHLLTGFEELKLCTAYRVDGEKVTFFPANLDRLEKAEPVYDILPGWTEDLTAVTSFDGLPVAAQDYVKAVEKACGKPVALIGVGPKRSQTIQREG